MENDNSNNGCTTLAEVQFKNGDRVLYLGGLTFVFVGKDPFDENYAYCIHPTAICQNDPRLNYKRVDRLLIDKLTHCR